MEKGINSVLQKITNAINQKAEIAFALVYGSFAKSTISKKNTTSVNSDIDIGIAGYPGQPLTLEFKVKFINELSILTGREIDLLDLDQAAGTVLSEAMTLGVTLKRNPDVQSRLLMRMTSDHEDFQKMKNKIMTEKRKKAFHVP